MSYEVIKALHIIAVMSWMAGLLYLPRLYVYHAETSIGEVRAGPVPLRSVPDASPHRRSVVRGGERLVRQPVRAVPPFPGGRRRGRIEAGLRPEPRRGRRYRRLPMFGEGLWHVVSTRA